MGFSESLDKYLTSSPYYVFDNWIELVTESLTEDFLEVNEEWVTEYDGQCNEFFSKLYDKDAEPVEAAKIIERAFKLIP